MIVHILIGAVATTGLFMLFRFVQNNDLNISWWQWVLTVLGILYTILVVEVIVGFLNEGTPQAALIMGLLTGIIAIIWGVLLNRFVFAKK